MAASVWAAPGGYWKKEKNIINIKQFEIPYCGFIWPGNKIIHMYFSLVKYIFVYGV